MKNIIFLLIVISLIHNLNCGNRDQEKKEREEKEFAYEGGAAAAPAARAEDTIKINLKNNESVNISKSDAKLFELFKTLIDNNPDIKEIDAQQIDLSQFNKLIGEYLNNKHLFKKYRDLGETDEDIAESLGKSKAEHFDIKNEVALKDTGNMLLAAQYLGAPLVIGIYTKALAQLLSEGKFTLEKYQELFPRPVLAEVIRQSVQR